MKNIKKTTKKFYKAHKNKAQIGAIITLILGIVGNHFSISGNKDWMVTKINNQAAQIQALQTEEACLRQKVDDFLNEPTPSAPSPKTKNSK